MIAPQRAGVGFDPRIRPVFYLPNLSISGSCTPKLPCDNLTNCPGHVEGIRGISLRESATIHRFAGVAQLVEHLICNQRVRGSNPFASSRERRDEFSGRRRTQLAAQQVFPTHSIRKFSGV